MFISLFFWFWALLAVMCQKHRIEKPEGFFFEAALSY